MKATGLITVAFKYVNASGMYLHFHSPLWMTLQGLSFRGAHVIHTIFEAPARSVNFTDAITIKIIQRHLYNSGCGDLALHFQKRCHAKEPSVVKFHSLPDLRQIQ